MRQELKLESEIPISVNHYIKPRPYIQKMGGKSIPRVTMYETAEAKLYKRKFAKHIKEQIALQGWSLPDVNTFIVAEIEVYFPRVDMDSNNIWKLLLDTCTECGVWIDDNKVLERTNNIYYDPINPRVEITIYKSARVGIFKDEIAYNNFKDKFCNNCTRGSKNNCSIHKKMIESRIQEEANENTCSKFKQKK